MSKKRRIWKASVERIIRGRIGLLSAVLTCAVLVCAGCGAAPKSLSEEEIERFNTEFFNGGTYNMNNMLLSGEYGKPEEIDLFQLFYNGIGGAADQESEEELAQLAELDENAVNLDVMKVTAAEMDAFLKEKLGIGLSETQKIGLDRFYYLEDYDSYYLVAGDTNFQWCRVASGTWEDEELLVLEYEKEDEEGKWRVTLRKTDAGYLFVSNEKA
ncbi:MAG: hypothetical protein NC399_04975 [Muribaculum sp.]|nr:hypothetical protein [Muribaculum sp.]